MEVTILLGSPHLNGNTASLAAGFSDGAKLAGANVVRIDVDQLGVSPVDAKLLKRLEAGENVDADGMDRVIDRLLASDVVVFATPLYYYGSRSFSTGSSPGTANSSNTPRVSFSLLRARVRAKRRCVP